MSLTTVELTKRNVLFSVRIADLITEEELTIALTWFATEHAVVVFIIDFLDYQEVFGNDLKPRDVDMDQAPSVFDVIVRCTARLRLIMRLKHVFQVTGFRYTKTSVFIVATHGVFPHERPSHL